MNKCEEVSDVGNGFLIAHGNKKLLQPSRYQLTPDDVKSLRGNNASFLFNTTYSP